MSDYDIHSCGYYCDRPACIERQRNELRDKLFEEIHSSERNIQTSDKETPESSQPWVKTYSGGKPNYTQPEQVAQFNFQEYGPDNWGDSQVTKPEFVSEQKDKNEALRSMVDLQREWVGLTNEEISQIYTCAMSDMDFIFDTQAKLKEKNT